LLADRIKQTFFDVLDCVLDDVSTWHSSTVLLKVKQSSPIRESEMKWVYIMFIKDNNVRLNDDLFSVSV
jgi:hypothetical protein